MRPTLDKEMISTALQMLPLFSHHGFSELDDLSNAQGECEYEVEVCKLDTDIQNIPLFDTTSIPGFAVKIIPRNHAIQVFATSSIEPSNVYIGRTLPACYKNAKLKDKEKFAVFDMLIPSPPSRFDPVTANTVSVFEIQTNNERAVLAGKRYKPVAKRTKPVAATLPEEFRATRQIVGDPLLGMPTLCTNPPDFKPTEKYTDDRRQIIDDNHKGDFLWPEERKLLHHFMTTFEKGFAWDEGEKGRFRNDFFPPVKIPVVPHTPWVLKNYPIPSGIYNDILQIIRDKIAAGTYKPSSSSYHSRWFTVLKKNGKLRIVHDLQPLNAVTIRNSALPPFTEQLAEGFGGKACYGLLDFFVGYDKRVLDIKSQDLTTFQTPLGAY